MTNDYPPGRIGIVSRSPEHARDAARQLAMFSLGASKVVCLRQERGDSCLETLKMFEDDWGTDAVLLLGGIDESESEACMAWMAQHRDKPVIGFIDEGGAATKTQRDLLCACGVHLSRDAATIGELAASVVELPWLPFD